MPASARTLRLAAALTVGVALVAPPVASHAGVVFVDNEDFSLSFGGYARTLSSWIGLPTADAPEAFGLAPSMGLSASILRAELKMTVSDWAVLDVHSRLSHVVSSVELAGGFGGAAGLGVSAPPTRSFDLSASLLTRTHYQLDHDIDRLAFRLYLGPVDVAIGRQAVTWGVSLLFPVADIWTSFSPFDLDTSQKRGVDAVRASFSPTDDMDMDILVADRGSWEDLGVGVRAVMYLDAGDLHLAAAKSYEELILTTGVSAEVDVFKIRGEVTGLFDLDDSEVLLPRLTAGVDWFYSGDFMMSAELHFNGLGAGGADEYAATATSEPPARGETYLLGRWYAGILASYKLHELLTVAVTPIVNLADPSALLTWSMAYDVSDNVDMSVGGFHALGAGIDWDALPPELGSELGSYGQQLFLQMAIYF